MEKSLKIQVPKPCHEDWNTMIADENGKFCGSCAKSVIDFTKMKAPEIQEYFIRNQGRKICGRFNNGQLESVRISVPAQVLFSQTQFHKMFLLALFIAMGTTLFSCSNGNGDKQAIDSVEVVNDVQTATHTLGAPMPPKNDTLNFVAPPPPPKLFKNPKVAINGEVEIVPLPKTTITGDVAIDTIN